MFWVWGCSKFQCVHFVLESTFFVVLEVFRFLESLGLWSVTGPCGKGGEGVPGLTLFGGFILFKVFRVFQVVRGAGALWGFESDQGYLGCLGWLHGVPGVLVCSWFHVT